MSEAWRNSYDAWKLSGPAWTMDERSECEQAGCNPVTGHVEGCPDYIEEDDDVC